MGEQTEVAAVHPEIAAKLEADLATARFESVDWKPRRKISPQKSK